MSMNTEELVELVKLESFAPISEKAFSDSDLISLLNANLFTQMMPDIVSMREDYFLDKKLYTITAGQSEYILPERCIGSTIKYAYVIDSAGNRTRMTRIQIDDLGYYDASVSNSFGMYYIRGDKLVLHPSPQMGSSLEVWYLKRPNKLIATTSCAKITAQSLAGGQITYTVDTDLSASLVVGSKIDIISANAPNQTYSIDQSIVSISSTQIVIASTDMVDASSSIVSSVGDYICPSKSANFPLIPDDLQTVLAQMAVVSVLQSLGDNNKLQVAQGKLNEMRGSVAKLITNRVEAQPPTIVNRRSIANHSISSFGNVSIVRT